MSLLGRFLRYIESGSLPVLSTQDASSPDCPPELTAMLASLYAAVPDQPEANAKLRHGDGVYIHDAPGGDLLVIWKTANGTLAADVYRPRRRR